MTDNGLPIGQLFSHVYLSGGPLLRDKKTFRSRLGFYCSKNFRSHNQDIGEYLREEVGLEIRQSLGFYYFEDYFNEIEIRYVLNAITLIWQFFCRKKSDGVHQGFSDIEQKKKLAESWRDFVVRVLREEGMGYQLDAKCGVHFFVDEAFERGRQSIIPTLGQARYAGVLAAFEGAYSALDSEPQDTKQAVRLIFEAVEILAKLMQTKSARLDRQLAETIRDKAKVAYAGDETACNAANKMFASFVDWIDGLHFYRHGQGIEDHVSPPLDMAIFAISCGTSYLRWLIEIDARSLSK